MGRAFNLMEKRVSGRTPTRERFVRQEERIRSLEVALLELFHYMAAHVATDGSLESDTNLVAAGADFEQTLERTVRTNGR